MIVIWLTISFAETDIVLYTGLLMDYYLPPDNTQVFIMDYHNLLKLSAVVFSLKERGYNIVLVCPEEPAKEPPEKLPEYAGLDLHRLPWESVLQGVFVLSLSHSTQKYNDSCCFWTISSFFPTDAKISETCSVNCRICHLAFSSLADFTVHLNSEKHANLVSILVTCIMINTFCHFSYFQIWHFVVRLMPCFLNPRRSIMKTHLKASFNISGFLMSLIN